MKRPIAATRRTSVLALALAAVMVLSACGTSEPPVAADEDLSAVSGPAPAAGTCLAGDPACEDFDDTSGAGPPPGALDAQLFEEDGAVPMTFGGFFHSDGLTTQLCGSLAESFPPMCGESIIVIDGQLDFVLESVRESFGNPDDARLFNEGDVWWTDEFINLSGDLTGTFLVMG